MTIQEIIEKTLVYHPDLGSDYNGCDGVKAGDPKVKCTGIVSSLVPTAEVIQKTIELGANLLYVHEPTSYLTPDTSNWDADFACRVYEEKLRLAREHGIVIFRDHDHMHAHGPDSIFTGVLKYMGWLPYLADRQTIPFGFVVDLPAPRKLRSINDDLIRTIGMNGLRYIGDPDTEIRRLSIAGHIYPDAFIPAHYNEKGRYIDYATEIIRCMEEEGVECILPGEVIEWTVLSYIRDANTLGKKLACINAGHFNWEELGARYAADWLKDLVGNAVPVTYVPTGDIWSFQLAK